MRLVELRVRGFKRLQDLHVDLDHDRLLVVGDNEAGKTTLLEALLTSLYGLAPAKRGKGHAAALREVTPWDGSAAGVGLTVRLDDGRVIEVDWELTRERTQVLDRSLARDITTVIDAGPHGWLDVGSVLSGLPAQVFRQVTCVSEGQLASIGDGAEIRQTLLRLAESGLDAMAEQAILRLADGARQATIPRTSAATRRNGLERELVAAEARLASALDARRALEEETEALRATELSLTESVVLTADLERTEAKQHAEIEAMRRTLDHAGGRLAEAEARVTGLPRPRVPVEAAPPWSAEEMDAAREALAVPEPVAGRGILVWAGLVISAVGIFSLIVGLMGHAVVLVVAGFVVIGIGVYALTQPGRDEAPLLVSGHAFPDRLALMHALERQRAEQDLARQREEMERAEAAMREMLRASVGDWDREGLATQLAPERARRDQLRLDVEARRASLQRAVSLVPEVAPLEEHVGDLHMRLRRLEAFGAACELAAQTLTRVSTEMRRAYAPRLQAHLGRTVGRVTGGRYTEAMVSDDFGVWLRAPETETMVELDRLSRGTQQQVYLLLRLALLDVIGQSATLPLLLDDALALCDDGRSRELLAVLADEPRQVIYFAASERAGRGFGEDWARVQLASPNRGQPAQQSWLEGGQPAG